MKFVIVDDDTGLAIWSHDDPAAAGQPPVEPGGSVMVPVNDGLFSVMLGLGPDMVPITGPAALNLGRSSLRMWVSTGGAFERLSDQMLASSPSALSVRQVDPGATNTLARWDGMKLALASDFKVDADGNLGIRAEPTRNFPINIGANSAGVASVRMLANAANFVMGRDEPNQWAFGTRVDVGGDNNDLKLLRYRSGSYRGIALQFQSATGNVGINTSEPSERLDVDGRIRSRTGGFVFPDGTVQTTAVFASPTLGATATCIDAYFPCSTMDVPQAAVVAACESICADGAVSASGGGTRTCIAILDISGQSCSAGAFTPCSTGSFRAPICCVCKVQ